MSKRVLIFGTFDGFHEGHKFVVQEAAKKGSELVVAVARDEHVRTLKNKEPRNNEQDRMNRVSEDKHVTRTVLSDEILGTYRILDEVQPDLIALGFDQVALKEDLSRWMLEQNRHIPIETLDVFKK